MAGAVRHVGPRAAKAKQAAPGQSAADNSGALFRLPKCRRCNGISVLVVCRKCHKCTPDKSGQCTLCKCQGGALRV